MLLLQIWVQLFIPSMHSSTSVIWIQHHWWSAGDRYIVLTIACYIVWSQHIASKATTHVASDNVVTHLRAVICTEHAFIYICNSDWNTSKIKCISLSPHRSMSCCLNQVCSQCSNCMRNFQWCYCISDCSDMFQVCIHWYLAIKFDKWCNITFISAHQSMSYCLNLGCTQCCNCMCSFQWRYYTTGYSDLFQGYIHWHLPINL